MSIGDTVKFGRVRYKIVMMNNDDQVQKYSIHNRFNVSNRSGMGSKSRNKRNPGISDEIEIKYMFNSNEPLGAT